MTEKSTEVPPPAEPAAPEPPPATARAPRGRRWILPLALGLVVAGALVGGGVGGYAIATATGAGRPAIAHGQFPGMPEQGPGADVRRPSPDGAPPERPRQGPPERDLPDHGTPDGDART